MSDLSIPGVSNRFRTDELIKNLLEVEKIPLRRMEESVATLRTQQRTWRELQQGFTQLRDRVRDLYGARNPFNERIAQSSDPTSLTATATRDAIEGTYSIEVKRMASADRFLSSSLPLDTEAPPGRYGFKVGDREISFQFRGGRLSAFVEQLKDRGRDLVTASIIRNTPTTQVLLIESLRPGIDNPLTFTEASTDLGERLGILQRDPSMARSIEADQALLSTLKILKSPAAISLVENMLRIDTGGEFEIPLVPPLPISPSMIFEAEARLRRTAVGPPPPPAPPPGPDIPERGGVTLSDVTILHSPSQVVLPEWRPPPPPVIVQDLNVFSIVSQGEVKPLPPMQESEEFISIRVPLQTYGNLVESVLVKNNNTFRILEIKNIRMYDPATRGEHRPIRPIATAQDAEILLNSVPVTRGTNTIEDLIPGVTLTLSKPGDAPVSLSVEPDREAVKDAIISFVGTYNRQLGQINILTRTDEAVISELTYLSTEEQDRARERLGLLQGDIGLMQLRNSLQSILMNPHPTRLGRDLSLLSQIGISTNAQSGRGRGIDATKLRGYLEINEPVLDEALKRNFMAVKDLFGFDSDRDLIPDSGVGVALENFLRPYVQFGGIFSTRLSTIDTQITSTNRRIESFNQYLARFEQDLRRRYGIMESTLNQLEQSSEALDRFNNAGQRNR